jgi:tetratricopeptide (TPR) repeat protein
MLVAADLIYYFKEPSAVIDWISQWGSRPVIQWIKGAKLFAEGDYLTASKHYKEGLTLHPNHRAAGCARVDLAYCMYRLGELLEAERLLLDIVGRDVPREETYVFLAQIQSYLGRPISALRTLAAASHVYPDDISILAEKLNISLFAGLNSRTIKKIATTLYSLRNALSYSHPDSLIADTALAHYEIRCADRELGFRMLVRVLGSGSADAQAYLINGERFLEDGNITQAREQFSRAQRQNPLNPWSSFLLSRSYLVKDEAYFNGAFAVQLAVESCKISRWENVRILKMLQASYESVGDLASAELIKARIGTLSTAKFNEDEIYSAQPASLSAAARGDSQGKSSAASKG